MRPEQQLHLAEVLREHREKLEATARELADRGLPISELEARLLADAGTARLREVENALRQAAEAQRRAVALRQAAAARRQALAFRRTSARKPLYRRIAARVRSWAKPRIGRLQHYAPRPIVVPARYFRTQAPTPAPTISIVTPSYGQGQYVARTIYSVVAQRYPALEYHVQDGGSADDTLSVLTRLDGALTSWTSEPDDGQADAINRGFRRTTGEIMAWLNSDDLLLPGSLAYVARYFAEHPSVDVVYGHRIMIDETDGQIGAWILPAHDRSALRLADYVPQETLFWRRRIWEAAGGHVDPSFEYALDWDLLLRFQDAGARIVRLPRFLGAFRVHDEQKTSAQDALGLLETQRLRERIHGRPVPIDEVLQGLKPYFARHIAIHSWHRFVDRLPASRRVVQTRPDETFFVTPGSSAHGGLLEQGGSDAQILRAEPRGARESQLDDGRMRSGGDAQDECGRAGA